MLPVAAALGWTLAVYLAVCLVRAVRVLRGWRRSAESLCAKHQPDDFARYTARLVARGDRPLITQPPPKEHE